MRVALFFLLIFAPMSLVAESFLPSSFHIEILQEYESALPGGEKRQSEGSIVYRYPGHIRFEITTPDKIVFVSDNKKSWYYTAPAIEGEPGELNISEASESGLSRFFDSLQYGLKTNESYAVEKNENQVTLTFEQKVAQTLDIKKAVLSFKNSDQSFSNIQRVDLTYLDDHETQLVFKKINLDAKIDEGTFKFEVPANTRINRI